MPSGPDVRLHRRLPYGTLADFTILDTRQYRSDQPCGGGRSATCDERFDPDRAMLGGKQKEWLLDGFSESTARWQVLGNQAPISQTDWDPSEDVTEVWLDPWDGYVVERDEVLGEARERGVRNLVAITGDRHTITRSTSRPITPTRIRRPSAVSSSAPRSPVAATART